MKREKVPGVDTSTFTVYAGIEVSRVPSDMPCDPQSRVTSRVIIRDHRSPIRRNKRARRASRPVFSVFLSQLMKNTICLYSPPLLGRVPSTVSPTCPFFSFILPTRRGFSPLYNAPGDHFRRPVNLLVALVFALPSHLPCWHRRCASRTPWFHNNRPSLLVVERVHLRENL